MYKLIRPVLFQFDSEKVHEAILHLATGLSQVRLAFLIKTFFHFEHPALHTNFLGMDLLNPVGLAAGFDKSAQALSFWQALGFGFMECGNITANFSTGNLKPRIFRLPKDRALINRVGLANIGADAMEIKLQNFISSLPFGINIAKTHDPQILGDKAIADFLYTFKKMYPFGQYITINVSCPNTLEGKTFEDPVALNTLLGEINKVQAQFHEHKPILVKISPDVSFAELEKILEVCEAHKVNGYVLTNTSKHRAGLKTTQVELDRIGKGGLSGKPIYSQSNDLISHAYKLLKRPCLIGLGGVDSAESAYEKIQAGASLVQIYTGLVYEGPSVVKKINQGLVKCLERDGFKNIKEAVGIAIK
jgi:dihydroorotate dehydrogenase